MKKKKSEMKMTDELPCAHCKELTTAFYETSDGGKVKMCQKCIDAGWRPQIVSFRNNRFHTLLGFCKTAEPVNQPTLAETNTKG